MELITVKTFDYPIDAHLLKSKLESEGINCYLFDEHNSLICGAMGGVKLKISKTDIDKTKIILSQIENTPLTNDNNTIIKCPACDSPEIYSGFKSTKGLKGFLATILSFSLLGFPFFLKNVYKCKDCDTEFTE